MRTSTPPSPLRRAIRLVELRTSDSYVRQTFSDISYLGRRIVRISLRRPPRRTKRLGLRKLVQAEGLVSPGDTELLAGELDPIVGRVGLSISTATGSMTCSSPTVRCVTSPISCGRESLTLSAWKISSSAVSEGECSKRCPRRGARARFTPR